MTRITNSAVTLSGALIVTILVACSGGAGSPAAESTATASAAVGPLCTEPTGWLPFINGAGHDSTWVCTDTSCPGEWQVGETANGQVGVDGCSELPRGGACAAIVCPATPSPPRQLDWQVAYPQRTNVWHMILTDTSNRCKSGWDITMLD